MISVENFNYIFASRITYSALCDYEYEDGASLDLTNPEIKMDFPYLLKKYNHNFLFLIGLFDNLCLSKLFYNKCL